jgi:S-formylglutathione hydrolase FrmB
MRAAEGPQRWETCHLDELRPFIEARSRTRTDRGGRAIAGLSVGGFGAMSYVARHPTSSGSRRRSPAHNPLDLAANLHGVETRLRTAA